MIVKKVNLVLSIDVDETTLINKPFPHILGFRKGAKYFINKLYDEGHYIIFNTCRTDNESIGCYDETMAKKYITENGVKWHKFNNNHPGLINHFQTNCRKISSDIIIDDKSISLFGLPPWWMIYLLVQWKQLTLKKRILNLLK